MSQQISSPSVCVARQFYMSRNQNKTFRRFCEKPIFERQDFSGLFSHATLFVHQWQQHQTEGRVVQLVSCGGHAETIYMWRRETTSVRDVYPILIWMTDDMWHMVAEIGYELGYIASWDMLPDRISNETMASIMSSIWDMYLVVCSRVLIRKDRVKVPSRKAAQALMAPNGTVLMPKVPGDRAQTIPLV